MHFPLPLGGEGWGEGVTMKSEVTLTPPGTVRYRASLSLEGEGV